jgi:carboxyl-terminal processing protease
VLTGLLVSLIFLTGFVAGSSFGRTQAGSSSDATDPGVLDFLTAYHLITQHSYYRPFDKQQLMYAAIDGMMSATGDPHTVFLSPSENRAAQAQLDGTQFSGIGALVVPVHGDLEVWAPLPSTPATRAGLRAGDLVTKINGRPVASMSGDAAINRIHGRPGTVVQLTVSRPHRSPFVVTVKRAQIPPVTAYGRMLDGRLGYIQILSFGDSTSREVAQAISFVKSRGAQAVILDLRDNPGGYVDAAQQVVSDFLTKGVVAYEKNPSQRLDPLPVLSNEKVLSLPLAVLVNEGTASAAEITAGALQDYGRGVLIGTRTYGKGSMQSIYPLADGSTVRITDRVWLTPKKHSIQSTGIRPNLVVGGPNAGGPGTDDPQLAAAEHYLRTHGAR